MLSMKKLSFIYKITIFIILVLSVIVLLNSCLFSEEYKHYKNRDEYVLVEGNIVHILNQNDNKKLILEINNLSYQFSDICFKIVGKNYDVVFERSLIDELSVNDKIIFHTIPGYLGDGYVYPIVSVEVNGVRYLDFEEGYENLIQYYR